MVSANEDADDSKVRALVWRAHLSANRRTPRCATATIANRKMRTYEYKIERAPYPVVGDYQLYALSDVRETEYAAWLNATAVDGWEFVSIIIGASCLFRRPAPPLKGIIFCDHALSREERKAMQHAWESLYGAPAQEKD